LLKEKKNRIKYYRKVLFKIPNTNRQFTKKTTLMPLLLMKSDGVTNCSQKLLHVARTVGIFFAKLLQ